MSKIRCDCYSFLDKDFNIIKTMSGEELEKKYNITKIEEKLNNSKDFYLDGFLIIENDIASKELLKSLTSNEELYTHDFSNIKFENKQHQKEYRKNIRMYKKAMKTMSSLKNADEHFKLFEETIDHYYYISTTSEIFSIHKKTRKRYILKKLFANNRAYVPIFKNNKNKKYYIDEIMEKSFFSSLNKKYKIKQIIKSPANYSIDNLIIIKKEYWELLENFVCFHESVKAKYYVHKNGVIIKENRKNGKIEKLTGRFRNNRRTIKFDKREKNVATIVLETFYNNLPKKYTIEYIDGDARNCSFSNLAIKEYKANKTNSKRDQEYINHEEKVMNAKGYRIVAKNSEYTLYVNKNGQFLRISIKTGKQYLIKLSISQNKKHYQIKVNGKARYAEKYIVETYWDYFKEFKNHNKSDIKNIKYKIEFKDNDSFNLNLDNILIRLL